MKQHSSFTFRLFKKQTVSPFIEGMASILDYSNTDHKYHFSKTDAEADESAIQSDWKQVGADLRSVMRKHATR